MAEYLSPGVYIEEENLGPVPIEGVSTSTAGAVGVTVFGPTEGKPVLVTSFAEYVRKFGGYVPLPDAATQSKWNNLQGEGGRWWTFAHSVKGFFDNGGQRLFVKRVLPRDATFARETMGVKAHHGLTYGVVADAALKSRVLRLSSILGIAVGSRIRLFSGSDDRPISGELQVDSYDSQSLAITLNVELTEKVSARRGDYVRLVAENVDDARSFIFSARSRGIWGNSTSVRISPVVAASLPLLPKDPPTSDDPNFTTEISAVAYTTTLTVRPVDDGADISEMLYATDGVSRFEIDPDNNAGTITIGDRVRWKEGDPLRLFNDDDDPIEVVVSAAPALVVTITPKTPLPADADEWRLMIQGNSYGIASQEDATFSIDLPWSFTGQFSPGTPIRRLREAQEAGSADGYLNVHAPGRLYRGALVELDNGEAREVLNVGRTESNGRVYFTTNPANQYFETHVLRLIEAQLHVRVIGEQGVADESLGPVRLQESDAPEYIVTYVRAHSKLVEVSKDRDYQFTDFDSFPSHPGRWLSLKNGVDSLDTLSVEDFIGVDEGPGKRTGITALEDIDEISLCMVPGMWAPTVLSALMIHCETLKDRFAIVDPPDGLDIEGIRTFREPIDTKYATLYYPWLRLRDPLSKQEIRVAGSGHLAGVYARVDVERGVHKAPANEVVRGISGFAVDITKREQDLLNPKNINAMRYFPGRGNRVWGARVLTSDALWKYVNVRRLFIYVEESIEEGTQWVVFEPNNEMLWSRVKQSVSNFLDTVWRSGALMGTKANEAFFVKCDRSTMSEDDIQNGRLICLIGIAPVRPAEFVIFRIHQKTLSESAT